MPGSSHIFALLPCSNMRTLFADKPRTLTFDAEVVIGFDTEGKVQTTTALLNHFNAATEEPAVDGALYFVSGKVASMNNDIFVGENFDHDTYDFLIEADVMLIMPEDAIYPPCRACLTVAGAACASRGEREFLFDVRNFVAGQQRVTGHICYLPATNRRFAEKIPLPGQGKLIYVVGHICRTAIQAFGDNEIKRIPIEVTEIAFLGADIAPAPATPVRGKAAKFSWGTKSITSDDKGKRKQHDSDDETLPSDAPPSKQPGPSRRKRA